MNMQSAYGKKHAESCGFAMQSQVVTEYLRLVVEVQRQYGIFG